MGPLEALLNLLIGLAGDGISEAVVRKHEKALDEATDRKEALQNALASRRNLREELASACTALARDRARIADDPRVDALWTVLTRDTFQADLAHWITRGPLDEAGEARARLASALREALDGAGVSAQDASHLEERYFDVIERMLAANQVIANWRHQLTLDYLREQVAVLRMKAEEASGHYSGRRRDAALQVYCDKALKAWDIIDLSNLPEGDVQLATQTLLLRQLYLPLRVHVEAKRTDDGDRAELADLGTQRFKVRQPDHHAYQLEMEGYGSAVRLDFPGQPRRETAGARLSAAQRLVILGDPGGGKTTLLRWMATAFLLRFRNEPAFQQLPDVDTLPEARWIPVLIRCRDLGDADLCRSFVDFLTQHLYKTELKPDEAEVMRAVVLAALARGEALLLIDGLDEITNPRVRMQFCQEVERTAVRYPNAPIVVTSRIVGYRDMPYRMGGAFEHSVLAELTHEDKRLFAQRWIEVTEHRLPQHEREKKTEDLLTALESSNRIRQLAGNPMLLTTLALVKRKVGKLPSRRTKLYQEAVSLLLNFNPQYEAIEEAEAIPQLEYVAWAMCREGVQRLLEDELLTLLENVRRDYPNIRALRQREPERFLELLEARSGILIKSGGDWSVKKGREQAVWEFRHLTFQEYLAARAMIDGRYPGRDKTKSLAEQVAPLAEPARVSRKSHNDFEVAESWQEVLRMLACDCSDDDVDDVIEAIATPLEEEYKPHIAARLRLAARCLTDEPNVSEHTGAGILLKFCRENSLTYPGAAYQCAMEIGESPWAGQFQHALAETILTTPPNQNFRRNLCGVLAWLRDRKPELTPERIQSLIRQLNSTDHEQQLGAAVEIIGRFTRHDPSALISTIPHLCALLKGHPQVATTAVWALQSISGGPIRDREVFPPPEGFTDTDLDQITAALARSSDSDIEQREHLINVLGNCRYIPATDALIGTLRQSPYSNWNDAFIALSRIGTDTAIDALTDRLKGPLLSFFGDAIRALGDSRNARAIAPLLNRLRKPIVGPFDIESNEDEDRLDFTPQIILALAKLRAPDLQKLLPGYLEDTFINARIAAAAAMHTLGYAEGTALVEDWLTFEAANCGRLVAECLSTLEGFPMRYILSADLDGGYPYIDLSESIPFSHIVDAAERLNMSIDNIRHHVAKLADSLGIHIAIDSELDEDDE